MSTLTSINPSTYEVLGEVNESSVADVAGAVDLARSALGDWSAEDVDTRVGALRAVFQDLAALKNEYCILQSREMGMPISESLADFDYALEFADWYCSNAARLLGSQVTFESSDEVHHVVHEPIGVVAVIIPWNSPLNNVVWTTIQSLIAGNVVVLKHSEECPLSARFIEKVFAKHLPAGVFIVLYGAGSVGRQLLSACA